MRWLKKFLPRCVDFSDDGVVWRAGYGPRIRRWEDRDVGGSEVLTDQINYVLEQLTKDPCSRQAIIAIWDPGKDAFTVPKTKDYPCCNWVHFMIRDNKLDCTLCMRSNDAVWGYSSINVYEWTVLQEILAKCLKVGIGDYFHLSDSMHVYDRHWDKMEELLQTRVEIPPLPQFKFCHRPDIDMGHCDAHYWWRHYSHDISKICKSVEMKEKYEPKKVFLFDDIREIYWYLNMYVGKHTYEEWLRNTSFTDLKVSCIYWWMKNKEKLKDTGKDLIYRCIEEAKEAQDIV
jgi:hypothetical protein